MNESPTLKAIHTCPFGRRVDNYTQFQVLYFGLRKPRFAPATPKTKK